jgi:hypothetical protein
MISIGEAYFDAIDLAEQLLIRRLTIQRKNTAFFFFESQELETVSNLEEVHIIC